MPVLAVFIVGSIRGGDAAVVGLAVGIYWITKSLLQIPIGKYLDRNHGEKDDYWFMVAGSYLASLTPLLFLVSSEPWHIYATQVVHAIGMGMAIPPWGGLFTRHMDRGKETEAWAFETSFLGLGVGIAGIAGGFIAKTIGFAPLFIAVSVLGMTGATLLLLIKKNVLSKEGRIMHIEKIGHG